MRNSAAMRSGSAAILVFTMAALASPTLEATTAKTTDRAVAATKPKTAKAAEKPKASAKDEKAPKKDPGEKGEKKDVGEKPPASASKPPAPPASVARVRRAIAGGSVEKTPPEDGESAELRLLREMDLELFPLFPRSVEGGIDLPAPLPPEPGQPRVHATGLPKIPPAAEPFVDVEDARDLSWLRELEMPDLPARWDARVIRYLEYYRDNPRGRRVASLSIKRSGRWIARIRATLRAQGLPEDLVWASLVESAFNPTARSRAGAAGLWQFMPGTARIYGLTVDSSLDERLDPERATEAAARHLGDLYRRFGSWELALAAYNMGYGGLLAAIRKFNTNDYWELGRWESGIPWETTLYVPKIIAMAIVAKNPRVFGLGDIELDPSEDSDAVPIPSGVSLKSIANTAGVPESEIANLNPQIRAGKTPRSSSSEEGEIFLVRVPSGKGPAVAKRFSPNASQVGKLDRHMVRFGESLESIAKAYGTSKTRIVEMNALREGESVRTRSSLLVPRSERKLRLAEGEEAPVVVVPPTSFEHEGQRRVFYSVLSGDTLADIADAFGVLPDDLRRWNALDPSARLHEGMALQAFVEEEANLARIFCLEESEVRLLTLGSEEFYAHFEGLRGRQRAIVTVQAGDTWQKLGKKYDLTLGQLERINRRPRSSVLTPGETVVVYAPADQTIPASVLADEVEAKAEPDPLPKLEAPKPEDLPGEGPVAAKAPDDPDKANEEGPDFLAGTCTGDCKEREEAAGSTKGR